MSAKVIEFPAAWPVVACGCGNTKLTLRPTGEVLCPSCRSYLSTLDVKVITPQQWDERFPQHAKIKDVTP
jgi:hypothetical protein